MPKAQIEAVKADSPLPNTGHVTISHQYPSRHAHTRSCLCATCAEGLMHAFIATLRGASEPEYLTDRELARRLGNDPKTLQNKVPKMFRKGYHYFQKPGLGRRWRWDRVVEWLESPVADEPPGDSVPLAERGQRTTE